MSIKDICKKSVTTITKEKTLQEAALMMQTEKIGSLIVVDRKDESIPVGVLTDRDIALYMAAHYENPQSVVVADVMSRQLTVANEDDGICEILRVMRENEVNRVPLINKGGELCGIISSDDVLQLLAAELDELAGLRGRNMGDSEWKTAKQNKRKTTEFHPEM